MKTPTTIEHFKKFSEMAKMHRARVSVVELPSRERIRKMAFRDPYLNQRPLSFWDMVSRGVVGAPVDLDLNGEHTGRMSGASHAEAVSMAKHIAKYHVAGLEPVFVQWDDESLRGGYPRLAEWGSPDEEEVTGDKEAPGGK